MKVTFSGITAVMEWPGIAFGHISTAWVSVDELIVIGEQAKAHKEAERIRLEEYTWDCLMCHAGAVDA